MACARWARRSLSTTGRPGRCPIYTVGTHTSSWWGLPQRMLRHRWNLRATQAQFHQRATSAQCRQPAYADSPLSARDSAHTWRRAAVLQRVSARLGRRCRSSMLIEASACTLCVNTRVWTSRCPWIYQKAGISPRLAFSHRGARQLTAACGFMFSQCSHWSRSPWIAADRHDSHYRLHS